MDCQRVSESMYLFFDDEMEEGALRSFRSHVEQCPPCAQRLAYTRKLLTLLREGCARRCAPPALRERIRVSLRAELR